MAGKPVYRNYVVAYLGGDGNGKPVYRASGAQDAGKPLWKNEFAMTLTSRGTPPVGGLLDRRSSGGYTYNYILTGSWTDSGHTTPYGPGLTMPVGTSSSYIRAVEYRPNGTGYATLAADGGGPIMSRCYGRMADFAIPYYRTYDIHRIDEDTGEDVVTGSGSVSSGNMLYAVVCPWWGANNATVGYARTSMGASTASGAVSQSDINAPEGCWSLMLILPWGISVTYLRTIGVYQSSPQHKIGWPSMTGREYVDLTFSHLLPVDDDSGADSQVLADRQAYMSALSFRLAAADATT